MKKTISTLAFLLLFGASIAQNINLEQLLPGPEFQDSDAGDIELFDIDNDGDLDFIATGKGGPVLTSLYTNDGSGNFTEVTGTPFINVFGGSIGIEDVNNDGFLDVLITGKSTGMQADLYINDTSGNFTLMNNTPFQAVWAGDIAFSDVDNDEDKDVIISGEDQITGIIYTILYLNDGSGVFTEDMSTPFEQMSLSSVGFIDIENDGDDDVIMAGENSNGDPSTKLYTNDGDGNFTLVNTTPFENSSSGDIAITDSDNDGDLDIFLSGDTGENGIIGNLYTNDGTGSFSLVAGTPLLGIVEGEAKFADFDNDNDNDIFIVGISDSPEGIIVIGNLYENLGENNFVLSDEEGRAYISTVAIGDINGDELADIIIGGTSFDKPIRATKTYINQTVLSNNDFLIEQETITLYPNPAQNFFRVDTDLNQEGVIEIYTSLGKRVLKTEITENSTKIDFNLAAGTYFLKFISSTNTQTRKLIVN